MQDDPKYEHLSERLLGATALHHHDDDEAVEAERDMIIDPFQADDGVNNRMPSQTPEYRDVAFAIAFLAHLGVVVCLSLVWGVGSLSGSTPESSSTTTDDDSSSSSLAGPLWLCLVVSVLAMAISIGSLEVLTRHVAGLIQASLVGSVGFLSLLSVVFLASGTVGGAIVTVLMATTTALYAYWVWPRIAFAAANLQTAVSALQSTVSVYWLAYAMAVVGVVWNVLWVLAFVGIHYRHATCDDNDDGDDEGGCTTCHKHAFAVVLLLISYHWTSQVIKNVLHVTIAGVVGTWVVAPQEASSLMLISPALVDSFRRAISYSFGSICLGSLLVAIVNTLEQLVREMQRRDRGGILLCILQCLLHFLQVVATYFNKYAFVYVGLYGYDYVSAGKEVIQLFQERGWTLIIGDDLVQRPLSLVSLVAAGLTGLAGMLLAKSTGWATTVLGDDADAPVFFLCLLVGYTLSSILLSVVLSAVDTTIVCFASAPAEFERNHPGPWNQMRTAWRKVYPSECGF